MIPNLPNVALMRDSTWPLKLGFGAATGELLFIMISFLTFSMASVKRS